MSQLNIKSLWIQQIKMNNENITKSIETMVTDIKIELNQEENQLYEEIIRKIRENSKEINQNTELEMPQEGSTECEIPEEINGIIETETNEEDVIELNIEGSTETFNITENINNLEEIIKENRNNIMKRNYERISEEGSGEINGNDQMEIDFEENLSEELSELEDESPKVNKKRKHGNETQNTRKKRKSEKETSEMEKLIQELETPVIENEEVTEERTEENIGQDNIKELVGMFYEIERVNRKQIRKYYEYARKFEKEKEEIKRRSKKRISDKTAKSKLYEEMKEQIIGNITRITLRKRTHRAMKIYNLFKEIGTEKMNRFRDCTVETVIRLTKEEIEQIKNHFRRK